MEETKNSKNNTQRVRSKNNQRNPLQGTQHLYRRHGFPTSV